MTEDVPLRRERDLGSIIGDSFTLLFAHFGAFAGIVFPAAVTSLAFSSLEIAFEGETFATLLIQIAAIVAYLIVFEFVRSAGVVFLDQVDQQNRISSADALDLAQARIGIISGAITRVALISFVLTITIIGIPWAFLRLVRWSFISQMIMLEDKRGDEVLSASAELVHNFWWSTAGRLLVTGLITVIPNVIIPGMAGLASPIAGAFVGALLVFVIVPYGIISTTLMYFHLKERKARHDSITSPD